MRLRRILIDFFGNRMVIVHSSFSKDTNTQRAKAFGEERIGDFLTEEWRPKIQFWPPMPLPWDFLF